MRWQSPACAPPPGGVSSASRSCPWPAFQSLSDCAREPFRQWARSTHGQPVRVQAGTLKYKGKIVNLGLAGRDSTPFNPLALWQNGARYGIRRMTSLQNEYARTTRVIAECIERVPGGASRIAIDKKFSHSDAATAHACIGQWSAFGGVVLLPGTRSYGSNTALHNLHLAVCQPTTRPVSSTDPRRRVNGHERP